MISLLKKKLLAAIAFFLLCTTTSATTYKYVPKKELSFVVLITSYNNSKWAEKNLSSVLSQKYENFRIIYINDCSKDNTEAQVQKIVDQYLSSQKHKNCHYVLFDDECDDNIPHVTRKFKKLATTNPAFFTLVSNVNRCGALCNIYRAVHSCKDTEIIVSVDGDDWLAHPFVLQELNTAYSSSNIWLTHGTLMEYPSKGVNWCEPVPPHIIHRNEFRKFKCPSHLRTFYTWLFKKIQLKDLLYEGQFFPMTWDMAIMYPMIEMTGTRHAFISQPNYIYNMSNPINDNKVNAELQNMLDYYIRNQTPYRPLSNEEVP